MAVTNPPYVAQGRTDHPAVLFRLALAGLAGAPQAQGGTSPIGGVNPVLGGRLNVTGLASMNVTVDTGLAYIPNTTAWNGMYAAYQSTTTNVAIAAASSTQWRSDYIVAQITDPGDNTAAWSLVDVQGAFSSSAPGTLPAIPANAIPLSIIRVVPNMTVTNGGGTVNDARIWQPLPGPLMTTSSARPSLSSPEGTLWFETDTNNLGIIINGAYNYIPTSPAATDSWHTMSSFLNGWAATTNTPRYKLSGRNTVILDGAIDATSSTAGTFFTMPTGYRPISPNKLYAAGANGGVIANNSPFISVANTGSIATGGITVGTSGVHVTISGEYPLD